MTATVASFYFTAGAYHRILRFVAATRFPAATAEKSIWYTGKANPRAMFVGSCWFQSQLWLV